MEIFKLLKGRPLKIMQLLGASGKGGRVSVVGDIEMDVTTIVVKLRWSSQSSVSQDLAKLRKSGLVDREKRGMHVFYRLSKAFPGILNNLESPERHWALNKGKNRQLVIKFLMDNPGSKSCDICPELDRQAVSRELSVLRKARLLEFTAGSNKKRTCSLKI